MPDPAARRELPPGGEFGVLTLRDGAHLRFAVWAHPAPRGSVLLLSGRREFIEKYAESIRRLLDRGLSVFTFDWRGQGLSTRELDNRQKGYIDRFETYLADVDEFVINVLRARASGPLYALAHSMGGHNLLRYQADYGLDLKAAVLVAPMFGIRTWPVPAAIAPGLAETAFGMGLGWSYLAGTGDFGRRDRVFAGNRLTSDPDRFQDELAWIDRNPDLACGGPTWGWLRAAFRSLSAQNRPGYVERLPARFLLVSAAEDKVVDAAAQARMAARLPHAELLTLAGARHEILKERDPVQNNFWFAFDQWIVD